MKRRTTKSAFTLIELTITLVVGAILMIGMLPLIRIAANRGVEMQLQMRDVVELQSLVERISAERLAHTNLVSFKAAIGDLGPKAHNTIGSFYLHSSDFIEFDNNDTAQLSTTEDLLELRVGLEPAGPSLSKTFR